MKTLYNRNQIKYILQLADCFEIITIQYVSLLQLDLLLYVYFLCSQTIKVKTGIVLFYVYDVQNVN